MRNGILVNPVSLFPDHAFPTRNFSGRPRFIKGARFWTITKGLKTIFLPSGIPLVDNHLHWHTTTPDTKRALTFVGSGIQPPVTPLPIDLEGRWHSNPRWSRAFLLCASLNCFQFARLVVIRCLTSGISNLLGFSAHNIPGSELMLLLSLLANAYGKTSLFPNDCTFNQQDVTQIIVAPLVEGSREANARLDGDYLTTPVNLGSASFKLIRCLHAYSSTSTGLSPSFRSSLPLTTGGFCSGIVSNNSLRTGRM
jgi:hypothetical protein